MLFLLTAGEYLQQKYNYQAYQWKKNFYGKETYAELQIECTAEDRTAVQPVIDFADKAFSYLGNGDKYELFGELGKYCYNDYTGNISVASEKHNIYFLTARLDNDTGYLWVEYSQEGYNKSSEFITSRNRKSRWTLEKLNGEWIVSDILEHP